MRGGANAGRRVRDAAQTGLARGRGGAGTPRHGRLHSQEARMRRRSYTVILPGLALALAAGSALASWPPGGIHLERPALPGASGHPGIGPDGLGGTFIAWAEADSSGLLAFRIHRLTSGGDPPAGWTTTGVRAGSLPNWIVAP